ncbi:MAG: transcription elongation factor GreA [Candidatus Lambdaproteobacteria bacterium]|nr:transcription elongation factor GreA [Candidatus Lambdaproteobacteria bacterium]
MNERIPITKQGLERLKGEMKTLMTVERPAVQRAIAEARAHGDLRENAEFHAAKERQAFIEGRIQEIIAKMPNFQVVEPAGNRTGKVAFGATVTLENVASGESMRYQIVGPDEADLQSSRISFQSPIARALIGRQEGEVVQVVVPKGRIEVEITEVRYD